MPICVTVKETALTRLSPQDVVSTKRAIDNYCNADPSFATTRECKFLNSIADAYDGGDQEEFTAHVAEYDRCVPRYHAPALAEGRGADLCAPPQIDEARCMEDVAATQHQAFDSVGAGPRLSRVRCCHLRRIASSLPRLSSALSPSAGDSVPLLFVLVNTDVLYSLQRSLRCDRPSPGGPRGLRPCAADEQKRC